ncbi:putative transcriptional regulator [Collimonas sp. OK607]|uniref:YqgE/AlgH family protein n=1 Tax=Collimonas sp. OK607 TaxID=1798194 RepID=UPI0008F33780|nr:YqgE/AlgH family protein [Collimonas sp. OK607]SFA79923.1 putative transcriptional regulator [Collimonas sp. OK607]
MAKLDTTPEDSPVPKSGAKADADSPSLNLTNHFLIAMPSMLDPVFGGTVVYLCEHNANGALGVVINKPTDMTMQVLFDRIDLKLEISPAASGLDFDDPMAERPVMFGGPVQVERGFVLHMPVKQYSSTLTVTDQIAMTTSKDVLEEVAHGNGPQRILVSLGCSGWSAGQLESEIVRNGWLTVAADPAIIFELPIAERFAAAVNLLGISPYMLTAESGRA